jgi:hypothetical protein
VTNNRFSPAPAESPLWFKVWAEDIADAIDSALDDIETNVTAILAAQATATGAARELARINSYTAPGNVLSAADVGTTVTISIAAHTRVYPVQGSIDVADLVIPGVGTITGQPFDTQVSVYYDDTTLADTTPTYVATTTHANAQVGAATGRHFVGTVLTPIDGGPPSDGAGGSPPGGGGGVAIP